MINKLPKEMACWQAFSYVQPGLKFKGSLTHNKSRLVPAIKGSNQVLIKVKAASLNPIDHAQLRGYGNEAFHAITNIANNIHDPTASLASELPITPGRDFLGEIVSIGHSINRNQLKIGDLVVGSSYPFMSSLDGGSLAQYLVAEKCQFVKLTDGTINDKKNVVTLPYAGITAWAALEDSGSIKVMGENSVLEDKILLPSMWELSHASIRRVNSALSR